MHNRQQLTAGYRAIRLARRAEDNECTGEQKTVGAERCSLKDVERDGLPCEEEVAECESFLKNWTGVVTVNMSPVTTISSQPSNTLTLMR
jgi:hypothetical protein